MQESNQQLQQKWDLVSETRKGRADSDWKRIESEKRVRKLLLGLNFLHDEIVMVGVF